MSVCYLPKKSFAPHVIMTYTALLSLAILRDDFSKLDRSRLITLLYTYQQEDGRFISCMIDLCLSSVSPLLDLQTQYL